MASNSSNTMMWRGLSSPCFSWSFSALSNSFLTFYSLCPTYLLKISGPFLMVTSFAFKHSPSSLAIRVLPVPGGPNKRMPFTCLMPNFSMIAGGNLLEAKALLKILCSYLSSPPTFRDSILKPVPKISAVFCFILFILIFWPLLVSNLKTVLGPSR